MTDFLVDQLPTRSRVPIGRRLRLIVAVSFSLLLGLGAPAASFTAGLDRDTITLGETATLSLSFSGGEPKAIPNPPSTTGLQAAYAGQSSQITMVNGQFSSTITHSYTLAPRQAGEFQIPAFTVEVGGQKLTSQPLQLKVVQPTAIPSNSAAAGTELALLRLQLPKTEAYEGEIIVAELQLLLNAAVQNIEGFQLTAFPAEGFNAGKMVEGNRGQAMVGSARYTLIPLYVPLKAIKSGSFTAGPVTATIAVQIPSRRRARDPLFDFGIFGGEQRQVVLATDAQPVRVLPLPTGNVPPGFNGAVGRYTMSVSVGPTNVAVGDPITVKVQLSGRGTLDTLELPEQAAWRDFKTYPPTSKVELTDKLGLQGTKTFEQVVVPEKQTLTQLPGLTFSFFDPDAKAYRTLANPSVPLTVRPGGAAALPSIALSNPRDDSAAARQDIVHIKPRLGTVAQIQSPLFARPWFIALQSVPLVALVWSVVWRKRNETLARNPRLRRQREVAQLVIDGLAELRRLASSSPAQATGGRGTTETSDTFFSTLVRLLQEQIGERLDLPASAITEAVIDEQLRPRGVDETILSSLQDLFQRCNQARYAPVKSSEELSALVPKVEHALQQLQQIKL